ncbi:MAG: hypothetical protein ACREEY_17235, partial [Brevundimonas sp.]
MTAERVQLECRSAKGEHLGEIVIADRKGVGSLARSETGEITISELSEYDVSFRDATGRYLTFAAPVEMSPLTGLEGDRYGWMPRQNGLGVLRLALLEPGGPEA